MKNFYDNGVFIMFKKIINFAAILLAISFNNSESTCCLCFDQDNYTVMADFGSINNYILDTFADISNGMIGSDCFTVDSIDYENNNKKVVFKGIKTVESCEYVGLEGLNNFKPDIVFDCGNNKVNFHKIIGNNINSFRFISRRPIEIISMISVDMINNKKLVHNTKHPPIIGAVAVTSPYTYFELSLKTK